MGVIVGVMGNARAGKDTTAEYLAKRYGFIRIGLADPMKRFCGEVFKFSDEQLYGDKRDAPDMRFKRRSLVTRVGDRAEVLDQYLSPRYALQTLWTEWGRHCYNNVWIEYGLTVATTLLEGRHSYTAKHSLIQNSTWKDCAGVVFSDLRFKNEYDAVKKAGGRMVRINRPGFTGAVGIGGHASETEQQSLEDSSFDTILENDKDIPSLHAQIDSKFKALGVIK